MKKRTKRKYIDIYSSRPDFRVIALFHRRFSWQARRTVELRKSDTFLGSFRMWASGMAPCCFYLMNHLRLWLFVAAWGAYIVSRTCFTSGQSIVLLISRLTSVFHFFFFQERKDANMKYLFLSYCSFVMINNFFCHLQEQANMFYFYFYLRLFMHILHIYTCKVILLWLFDNSIRKLLYIVTNYIYINTSCIWCKRNYSFTR